MSVDNFFIFEDPEFQNIFHDLLKTDLFKKTTDSLSSKKYTKEQIEEKKKFKELETQFSSILKKHLLTIKILMAAVFFGLGIFLIWRA